MELLIRLDEARKRELMDDRVRKWLKKVPLTSWPRQRAIVMDRVVRTSIVDQWKFKLNKFRISSGG